MTVSDDLEQLITILIKLVTSSQQLKNMIQQTRDEKCGAFGKTKKAENFPAFLHMIIHDDILLTDLHVMFR